MDIEQQGAAGVAGIGDVKSPAGKLPDQPSVDGSEENVASLSLFSQSRVLLEEVGNFRSGEVGIEKESRLFSESLLVSLVLQAGADGGTCTALPYDGVGHRLARVSVPEDRRLALVGDPDGCHVGSSDAGTFECLASHGKLRFPDFFRIVFDESRLRENLADFPLRAGANGSVMGEHDGPTGSRALVER